MLRVHFKSHVDGAAPVLSASLSRPKEDTGSLGASMPVDSIEESRREQGAEQKRNNTVMDGAAPDGKLDTSNQIELQSIDSHALSQNVSISKEPSH